MQGGFPRGASLHVPPLAEVSRHWVPQQSDVVELPVGVKEEGEKEGGKVYFDTLLEIVFNTGLINR